MESTRNGASMQPRFAKLETRFQRSCECWTAVEAGRGGDRDKPQAVGRFITA